ncbi:hypothetical protein [Acinetobacter lwoffii]|uniref:hypothetical protein n=1 Tax=Acinetobacter lwoffii TaxID=28090 RepID=UPI0002CDF6CF|nr:hypothetical protein [Acinetobacter lwoffii]ENW29414.1 hypothetical protein F924_00979 [Acinetobacter lwoffii ATCC 9957 = CIP 70.31]
MDIQEIQEKFEDLLLANPDFDESLLEKDEEGCYSDSDIQHMYSMFEAGTEVGEQWQAAKAQAVPEGFVLIKDDTKTVVAIERMVEQQVEASGMDSRRLERLDGWKIIEAAVKAQEQAND